MHPDRPSLYPIPDDVAGDPIADGLLDAELDDALKRRDLITAARVAFAQSVRHQRIEDYFSAIQYSETALEVWRLFFSDHPSRNERSVLLTELHMLNVSIGQHFTRGHFDIAAERIQEARRLALFLPGVSLIASTEWGAAIMERWRGDSRAALHHAERALETYLVESDPMSIVRLSQFAAQLALDCAAAAGSSGETQRVESYLKKAHGYIDASRPPGNTRAALAIDGHFSVLYTTYSRLAGRNENRVALLEFVRQRARNLRYPFLEGLVFQALGDEYASHDGMSGQALGYYSESFRILLASDAPAYAVWPLRALKHEWEYSLDRFAPMLRF